MDLFKDTRDSRSSTMEPDSTDQDLATPYDSDSYSPRSCEFDLQSVSNGLNSPVHDSPSPSPSPSPQTGTYPARPLASTAPVPWEISDDEADEEEIESDKIMEDNLKKIGASIEEIKNSKRRIPDSEMGSDTETAKEHKRLRTIKEGILEMGRCDEVDSHLWEQTKDGSIRVKRGTDTHRTTSSQMAVRRPSRTDAAPETATNSDEGPLEHVHFTCDKLSPLGRSKEKDAEARYQSDNTWKGITDCVVAAVESFIIPELSSSMAKRHLIGLEENPTSETQDGAMLDEPQQDGSRGLSGTTDIGPLPRARTYMNSESRKRLDRLSRSNQQRNAPFKEGRNVPNPECSSLSAEDSGDDITPTPPSPSLPVPGCGSFPVRKNEKGALAVRDSHAHESIVDRPSKFTPADVLMWDGTQKTVNQENATGAMGSSGAAPVTLPTNNYDTLLSPPWEQQHRNMAEPSRQKMMIARRDLGCMDVPLPPIPPFAFGSVSDNMHLPPINSQEVPSVSSNTYMFADNGEDVRPCSSPILTERDMKAGVSSKVNEGWRISANEITKPPSHPVAGSAGISRTRWDPATQLELLAQEAEERQKAEAAENDKKVRSSCNVPVSTSFAVPFPKAREIPMNERHFSWDEGSKRRQALKQSMGIGCDVKTIHLDQYARETPFPGADANDPRRGPNLPLQAHQMQLMLLEQQNKKRLLMSRKLQAETHGREKTVVEAQIQAQEQAQKAQAQKIRDLLAKQRASTVFRGPNAAQATSGTSTQNAPRPSNKDERCKSGARPFGADNHHVHAHPTAPLPRFPLPLQTSVPLRTGDDLDIPRPPTRPAAAASQHTLKEAFEEVRRRKDCLAPQDHREKPNPGEDSNIPLTSPWNFPGVVPAAQNASWNSFQDKIRREKDAHSRKSPNVTAPLSGSNVPTEYGEKWNPHPPPPPPPLPPLQYPYNPSIRPGPPPQIGDTALPRPPSYPPPPPPDMPNGVWVRTITSPEGETTTMMQIDHPFLDFQNGVEVTTTTVKTATEVTTTTVTSLLPMMGMKGKLKKNEDPVTDTENEKQLEKEKENNDMIGPGSLEERDDDLYTDD